MKIIVTVTVMALSLNVFAENLIYKAKQFIKLEKVAKMHNLTLQELKTLNPQRQGIKNVFLEEGKEVIVSPEVHMATCEHKATRDDYLARTIRKYSYNNPYSLDLMNMINKKERDIVRVGEVVNIPYLYVRRDDYVQNPSPTCERLLRDNNRKEFLIRSSEAKTEVKSNGLWFFAGFSREALNSKNRYERYVQISSESMRRLMELEEARRDIASVNVLATQTKKRDKNNFSMAIGSKHEIIETKNSIGTNEFVAEASPFVRVNYKRVYDSSIFSTIDAEITSSRYRNNREAQTSIENKSFTHAKGSLGLGYFFDRFTNIQSTIGYGEMVLIKQTSNAGIFELNKESVGNLKLDYNQHFFTYKNIILGSLLNASYISSGNQSNADLNNGYDLGGGIQSDFLLNTGDLSASINYNAGKFQVLDEDLNTTILSFYLNYTY